MRHLGIDYGKKRIGLAISDERGEMAFPLDIVDANKKSAEIISKIIDQENAEVVVFGDSRDKWGEENQLMKRVKEFSKIIEEETKAKTVFYSEFGSSMQAHKESHQAGTKRDQVDDQAATIFLQAYLDSKNG